MLTLKCARNKRKVKDGQTVYMSEAIDQEGKKEGQTIEQSENSYMYR